MTHRTDGVGTDKKVTTRTSRWEGKRPTPLRIFTVAGTVEWRQAGTEAHTACTRHGLTGECMHVSNTEEERMTRNWHSTLKRFDFSKLKPQI